MQTRHMIRSILVPMLVLLIFGLGVYSRYPFLIRKEYLGEYFYIKGYLKYIIYGISTAVLFYFLSLRIVCKNWLRLGCVLIGLALSIRLLSSQLPLIYLHSGSRYIELFFVRFRISTVLTVILLLALCIIAQQCSTRWGLLLLSGLGLLFLVMIASEGSEGSTFVAVLLFLVILTTENSKDKLFKVIGIILYGVIIGGCYLAILINNSQYIALWKNPYADPLGKGYMKVQDFMIMKSALLIGKSQYNNTYSGEILPTILILFGWGAFIILLGILLLMQYSMYRLATKITEEYSKRMAFSVTAYFSVKTVFCVSTFLNILPFYSGGHLPFVGYGSEIIIDLFLLGVYFRCCHGLLQNGVS